MINIRSFEYLFSKRNNNNNEITVQVLYDNFIGNRIEQVVNRFLKERYRQHEHILSQYFCKIKKRYTLVLFIILVN